MKIYHKFLLYQNKWIYPYVRVALRVMTTLTYLASILLIVGLVYEHGFRISAAEAHQLQRLYHGVWIVFLADISLHIALEYKDTRRTFSRLTWILTFLLYLTLVPVVFHRPEVEGAVQAVWDFLDGRMYHLSLLLVLSFLNLSYGLVRLLRRTNPSLILAVSFLIIILVGTGLLMLPRSTVSGISWVDSLFISTSAVCVTGLTSVDVASTFTTTGFVIIILLIQIGGLGVMTLTSFFAMFFMGNTSLYNQLVVRDMVSSNSLNSLLSTLVYILGFTLAIEGAGMLAIWSDIHGTMGMDIHEELAFSAFHSISAFCNAGFSTLPGNLGNPLLLAGHHNPFYIYISLLIILGGIGFPILVNFKDIILYHIRRFWRFLRTWEWDGRRFYHLYNLNTRIVLIVTFLLLVFGTLGIALFEWNGSFAGMPVADKWTQAFFNAVCPRTAGFSSVDLAGLGVQTLLLYLILMWIGGGSQSTAGGIKVNAFAVVVLNLVAVLRGTERVEVFGRELSYDSIRRSNATVVMSFGVLFIFIFVISILEPKLSLLTIAFECVSAISTVGSSLNATPLLGDDSKLLVALLMFVGRVGLITLMLGIIKQKKHTKYRYPSGQIIIN